LPICPYCNEEYEGDWIVHAETCPNLPEKYRKRLRISSVPSPPPLKEVYPSPKFEYVLKIWTCERITDEEATRISEYIDRVLGDKLKTSHPLRMEWNVKKMEKTLGEVKFKVSPGRTTVIWKKS